MIWNWKDREHINGLGKESKEIEEVKNAFRQNTKTKEQLYRGKKAQERRDYARRPRLFQYRTD